MSEMTMPIWAQWLQALLTPTIAIAGVVIAVLNHLHARRKRKDDLFDRRYEFYKSVRERWMRTGEPEQPCLDVDDVVPIAEEAALLFGNDIAQHILSLEGKGHSGSPFFPNDDFTKPFEKYLRLGR
jgi:hypothetical protein